MLQNMGTCRSLCITREGRRMQTQTLLGTHSSATEAFQPSPNLRRPLADQLLKSKVPRRPLADMLSKSKVPRRPLADLLSKSKVSRRPLADLLSKSKAPRRPLADILSKSKIGRRGGADLLQKCTWVKFNLYKRCGYSKKCSMNTSERKPSNSAYVADF